MNKENKKRFIRINNKSGLAQEIDSRFLEVNSGFYIKKFF